MLHKTTTVPMNTTIAYIDRYCHIYYQYDIFISVVLDLSYKDWYTTQGCVTNWGSFVLLQIRARVVTNWGRFIITNWGKCCCYKLGQLLQIGAKLLEKIHTGKNWGLFSEFLTHTAVSLIDKELLFPEKLLVCGWNLSYLKVNGI